MGGRRTRMSTGAPVEWVDAPVGWPDLELSDDALMRQVSFELTGLDQWSSATGGSARRSRP
jgi:hypothetical protein